MVTREDFRAHLLPIGLAQLVGLACGLIGVRLNSALVAPADYGLYGIFTSLTPAGMWVIYSGLNAALTRLWAGSDQPPALLRAVLGHSRRRVAWMALLATGSAVLATREHWLGFALCLFAAMLGLGLAQYAHTILQAARQHWRDLSLSVTDSVTRTGFPPLMYVVLGATPLALTGGFVLHALASLLVAAWLLRPTLRAAARAPAAELPPVFLGSMFLGLAATGWAIGAMNRWVAAAWFGTETAGYFTLATNLAAIAPSMLGTIIVLWKQPGWFAAPHAGIAERRALAARVDRIAAAYTVGGLALAAALHAVLPYLVGPLIDARYSPALGWALGAGCFIVANTTGRFYNTLLFAVRQEATALPVELTVAVVYVAGSMVSAALGPTAFQAWLVATPLVPWLVNRPLARRRLWAGA